MALLNGLWYSSNDFFTDRLLRLYSMLLFTAVALFLTIEFHQQQSIVCWTPDQFSQSHVDYSHQVCSSVPRFHQPIEDSIPTRNDFESPSIPRTVPNILPKIKYLPLVLLVQAVLFALPGVIWRFVSDGLCNLTGLVQDAGVLSPVYTRGAGSPIVAELAKLAKSYGGIGILLNLGYMVVKALYWLVCIVQVIILSRFLGFNFFTFGALKHQDVTKNFSYNSTFENNTMEVDLFPKLVLCPFEIRHMSRVHSYTVQCSLEIGDTVEASLLLIWIWLSMVTVATMTSGALHFVKFILRCTKLGVASDLKHKFANFVEYENAGEKHSDGQFVNAYMKPDVLFALSVIEQNGSQRAAVWAVRDMWSDFSKATAAADVARQPLLPASQSTEQGGVSGTMDSKPGYQ